MGERPEIRLRSDCLEAIFRWEGDRYQHLITDGDSTRESCESKAIESPVFTDLHQQENILFASGISGDSHWSASIQSIGNGFEFDVACRAKSATGGCASFYRGAGLACEPDSQGEAPCELDQSDNDSRWMITLKDQETIKPPFTIRYRYRILAAAPID